MKIHKIILGTSIVLATLGLASCEDLVTEVDLPEYESKLVVQSFVSPDEKYINVIVSESIPVFRDVSTEIPVSIKDAEVYLSGEGTNVAVPWTDDQYGYRIPVEDLDPKPGVTYELSVKVPDGREAKGMCTIPASMNTSLLLTDISLDSNEFESKYTFNFRFTDKSGEGDHYRVGGYVYIRDDFGGSPYIYPLELERGDTYISDENKDGTVFTFRASTYSYYLVEKVEFFLLTTDEDYYKYHKSVEYNYGDDPFSEPTLVYTNIDGGLGVMCGFRTYRITHTF